VTVFTPVAQAFFVRRNFGVTVDTIHWGAAVKALRRKAIYSDGLIFNLGHGMTTGAFELCVGTVELKIRELMIEGFRVEH